MKISCSALDQTDTRGPTIDGFFCGRRTMLLLVWASLIEFRDEQFFYSREYSDHSRR